MPKHTQRSHSPSLAHLFSPERAIRVLPICVLPGGTFVLTSGKNFCIAVAWDAFFRLQTAKASCAEILALSPLAQTNQKSMVFPRVCGVRYFSFSRRHADAFWFDSQSKNECFQCKSPGNPLTGLKFQWRGLIQNCKLKVGKQKFYARV